MSETWRVGRSVGRTLYIGDRLVGLMDTPDLAEQVVMCVNGSPTVYPEDLTTEFYDPPDALAHENYGRGVRVTHRPTGLTLESHDERSQLMNKVRCYEDLKRALIAGVQL